MADLQVSSCASRAFGSRPFVDDASGFGGVPCQLTSQGPDLGSMRFTGASKNARASGGGGACDSSGCIEVIGAAEHASCLDESVFTGLEAKLERREAPVAHVA